MLILLCRHAHAADRDPALFPDDSLRPLIPKGRRVAERVGRRLARRGYVPTVVLSSPWKRAWQTAAILARETGAGKKRRVEAPGLAGEPNVAHLAEAVGARQPDEVVALVGHEPWLGELASLLLTGSPTRLTIDFPKGGVVAIETPTFGLASGKLVFMDPAEG